MQHGEGFVEPNNVKTIDIRVKPNLKDLNELIINKSKFQIEICDATEWQQLDNPKGFWSANGGRKGKKIVTKCKLLYPSPQAVTNDAAATTSSPPPDESRIQSSNISSILSPSDSIHENIVREKNDIYLSNVRYP